MEDTDVPDQIGLNRHEEPTQANINTILGIKSKNSVYLTCRGKDETYAEASLERTSFLQFPHGVLREVSTIQ